MKTVLVTGATGFLGKYLVELLVKEGYKVKALGRNEKAGKKLEELGAEFCRGDFTDKQLCEGYFENTDYVIHAGALSTVWGKWEDFYDTNVLGTRNVCELCIGHEVERLVYISSPSIYSGKKHRFDIEESDYDPNNRLNYYIRSKIMSEKIIDKYEKKGLYAVILRPRGLFGIGDTSLIPRILQANSKIGIPLFNQGQNYVDITCVENVAYACLLSLKAENVKGEVFNITNGEPMEFKQILELFLASIGESPKYLKLPFSVVYAMSSILEGIYRVFHKKGEPVLTRYTVCTLAFSQTLNISKAKEKLSYKPIKSMKEGIEDYGKWWKENQKNKAL